ncbi:hypothetical protein GGS20DRAFT_582324 [Poronia punctata]|nr:hypothetical protein GGS20DRAFT_582324 [Poronia punctata]
MFLIFIWTCLLFSYVLGNTEKIIFTGPPPADIQSSDPPVDYSHLQSLTPRNNMIRTYVEAESPNNVPRDGKPSWILLEGLRESQRYEVRVCWAATQPTMFNLGVYEPESVVTDSELLSELSAYAVLLQEKAGSDIDVPSPILGPDIGGSVLLLRILTTAEFHTGNHTLMGDAPPVFVDIIMDPFLLNILPRSLLPTVAYIVVVAIASWFIGNSISSWIGQAIAKPRQNEKYQ